MRRPRQPPSTCIINRLPVEILERILELAASGERRWSDSQFKASSMCKFSLVCKIWSRPARQLLYGHVSLDNSGQAMLLYETLKFTGPMLATFVRRLDTEGLRMSFKSNALARLLDVTPHLRWLSVYPQQCRSLSRHPIWRQITYLRVIVNRLLVSFDFIGKLREGSRNEESPLLTTTDLPSRLETLEITEDLFYFLSNCVANIKLPHLQTLKVEQASAWFGSASVEASGLSPNFSTPRIRSFEAVVRLEKVGLKEMLTELIKRNGDFVENLVLVVLDGKKHDLLSCGLLPSLPQLKTLEYDGPIAKMDKESCRLAFPPSLQRLNLAWQGSYEFGILVLELLSDKTSIFLPNLKCIPSMIYCISARMHINEAAGEVIKEGQLRKLMELSAHTHRTLLARCASREPTLSANQERPHEEFVCLPFPQAYRTSLGYRQRSLIKELKRSGRLPAQPTTAAKAIAV